MRYRSAILIIIACLFAAGPLLLTERAKSDCAARYGQSDDSLLANAVTGGSPCPTQLPTPPWARASAAAAILFALAGAASFYGAIRDRRREHALLRAVGVNVREEDLPLEP